MPSHWNPRLDGLIRVEAEWLAFARRSVNVWWLWTPPPVTAGQLHDAAETVAAWHSVVGAAYMSEDHELYGVTAADTGPGPIAMYSRKGIGAFGAVRNLVNPMLPAPQAPVIEWLTGPNRRRPHKTYMSGGTTLLLGFPLPTASTDMTVLEPLAAESLELGWQQLLAAFNTVAGAYMVVPRKLSLGYGVDRVTGCHVDRHWTGTRVRRGPKRQQLGKMF